MGGVLGFWTGVLVGAAIVGLAVIVLGPSRDVRAETGMDDEIEARILLGLDPEPEATDITPAPVHADANTGDFDALRQLEDLDAD
jgi:hypothetical protein